MSGIGCIGGEQDTSGIAVWGAPAGLRIHPNLPIHPRSTSVFRLADKTVELVAARNDVVDFQIVVQAERSKLRNVRLAAGDFADGEERIEADAIQFFKQASISVHSYESWFSIQTGTPGIARDYPDVLVPLGIRGGPKGFDVSSHSAVGVWVEIHVPDDAFPGLYRGTIEATAGRQMIETIDVELRVLDVAVPSERRLQVLASIQEPIIYARHLRRGGKPYVPVTLLHEEPLRDEAIAWLDRYMQVFHEHRVSPFLEKLGPILDLDDDGRVRLQWREYDEVAGKYLNGDGYSDGAAATAWPIPFRTDFPDPKRYGGLGSKRFRELAIDYLRQCAEHFREKGWFDRHFIFLSPADEFASAPYKTFRTYGRLIKEADPQLRLVCPTPLEPMDLVGWFGHLFEDMDDIAAIYCPTAQLLDPLAALQKQAAGKQVWWRDPRPPFAGSGRIEAPLAHARSWAWQAYRYPVNAIWLGRACNWADDPFAEIIDRNRQPSNQWLVYPGDRFGMDRPLPSARLKSLRRGLLDYEYLRMMEEIGGGLSAELIAGTMVKYAHADAYADNFMDGRRHGGIDEPDQWERARRLLLETLAHRRKQTPAPRDVGPVDNVSWRRFMEQNRELRVDVEGVRCRPSAHDEQGSFDIVFHVVLRNERAEPVDGLIRFGPLWEGWRPIRDHLPVEHLESGMSLNGQLVFRASAAPVGNLGVHYQPIVFEESDGREIEVEARFAFLVSAPLRKHLTIDGDLGEWPIPQGFDIAGDFVRVGGEDFRNPGPLRGRASEQTIVQALHDNENLYLAITCKEERMNRLETVHGNVVSYDGLLPWGEDLVEVLLDPSNAGSGYSHDIRHLVIKPSGAVISERGVATTPPIGPRQLWPAGAEVGVAHGDTEWTVELRIPMSAFGDEERKSQVWGFNVARHEARLGESSSWSGARRYFYNPRSLGNLAILRPRAR